MANKWGNKVTDYFGGSKIIPDGDCSQEIKRHLLFGRKVRSKLCLSCYSVLCLVTQSGLILCDPMDCSPPGFSVHGDSPGKNTGMDCHASSRRSSQPRDQTQVSRITSRFFTVWATREAHVYPRQHIKKQRHYFANKSPSSQSYGFSSSYVGMWELDHKACWALKNWCFWTVVLEKTLKSPLDNKEIPPVYLTGDQSWVFIGRTDAEAETLILGPPDVKNWLIWKQPDTGKD